MVKQSVLVIGYVWVAPKSSAAGGRMLQLIEQFLQKKWKVTFASPSQKNLHDYDLTTIGVDEVSIALNNTSFDEFLKQLQPTIVVFDRFMMEEQFGWRVAENCPEALQILDTEDLHFLRKVRHQQYKKGEVFTNEALLNSDYTKREIASILRCDLSLIISDFEMNLLQSTFKIDKSLLLYLPFLLDKIDKKQTTEWKSFDKRNDFVFIGNFFHKPNVDAVLTLKKYIWKTIKDTLPNAKMYVYGDYANQQIKDLHNTKEGFIIKGFAENAKEVIENAKVLLAPLNFGAGIKGKLTEAMVCGTPSVTTTIGAEGMHKNLPWSGYVASNYNEFSKKAITLYTDEKSWKIAQENGIEIINNIYDKVKIGELFINKIEELQQDLEIHRTQNFLGSLLQHQTLQATKYMSKWIEEKNK